ncbi:hypothetical protein BH20ACI4_BH20ACI4_12400 [soil metagenome]
MDNSEKDTLPNLQTVVDAISGLRQEMNGNFETVGQRLTNVEQRLTNVETDVKEIKEMQFVFENEFDRLLALSYKSLELSHENRADVRIMRKEIEAWSADVRNLADQKS